MTLSLSSFTTATVKGTCQRTLSDINSVSQRPVDRKHTCTCLLRASCHFLQKMSAQFLRWHRMIQMKQCVKAFCGLYWPFTAFTMKDLSLWSNFYWLTIFGSKYQKLACLMKAQSVFRVKLVTGDIIICYLIVKLQLMLFVRYTQKLMQVAAYRS